MKKSLINLAVSAAIATCGLIPSAFGAQPINPFEGADSYIDPDYAETMNGFFSDVQNSKYKTIATRRGLLDAGGNWKISTAVWLDNMNAIEGKNKDGVKVKRSVTQHLNHALASVKNNKPVALTFVIYDLPLRDCDAFSSNGEFKDASKLEDYKVKYINVIADAFKNFYSQPGSEKVRLALVIEPDSLPNMLTNVNKGDATPQCKAAFAGNVYSKGISYALDTFAKVPNADIAMYLDIAHSGWLGWGENADKIASIYNSSSTVDPTTGLLGLGEGFNAVRGFITNTSNYTPLKEDFTYDEYFNNIRMNNNFYEWNLAYDEVTYVAEIMSIQKSNGKLNLNNGRILPPVGEKYYEGKHFLIDTSRNGWIPADYVGQNGISYARQDRRHVRGNWCNIQSVQLTDNGSEITSSGLGELPQVYPQVKNPLYGNDILPIDAYVWIKPPGESDGFYDPITKLGDKMCSATDGGTHNKNNKTDSLQGDNGQHAPAAGQYFATALKNMIEVSGCISGEFVSDKFCKK